MANGTRILPSPTGGGLERGVKNFISARDLNRRADLEARTLDLNERIAARQEEISRKNVELAERGIGLQEQAQAFGQLVQIAPLTPPGSTIGELPFLQPIIDIAFADLDDSTKASLNALSFNPQTLKMLEDDRKKFFIEKLDPSKPEEAERLKAIIGVPTDIAIEAGEARAGADIQKSGVEGKIAGATVAAFDTINLNRDIQRDIVLNILGAPDTTVRIPGVDEEFESPIAAQIWADLAKHRDNVGLQMVSLSRQEAKDFAGELMGQLASGRSPITLGRTTAEEIVNAYSQSVGPDAVVDSDGNKAIERLFNESPLDIQKAIRVFTGSVRLGDNAYIEYLRGVEGGESQIILMSMGEAIAEDLNVPTDRVLDVLGQFLDSPQGQGLGIKFDDKGLFTIRKRFRYEEDVGQGEEQREISPGDRDTILVNSPQGQAAIKLLGEGMEPERVRDMLSDVFSPEQIERFFEIIAGGGGS